MPKSISEILASPFFTGLTRLQSDASSFFAGLGELRGDIESLVALENDLATTRTALAAATAGDQADAAEITRLRNQVVTLTTDLAAARDRIAALEIRPVYLSDRNPSASSNGWGPYERDRSNGGDGTADGPTITLRGTSYAKGLGVHAPSSITYSIGGLYGRFQAVVGTADYAQAAASVVFRVLADGVELFRSAVLTAASPPVQVDVSLTGRSTLQLIVEPNGSNASDHANWADARLIPLTSAPTAMPPTYIVLEGDTTPPPPPPPPPTPPPGGGLQPLSIVGWNLTVDDIGLRGAGVDRRLTSEGGDLTLYTGPLVIPANTTLDRRLIRGPVRIINPGIVIQRSMFAPPAGSGLPLVECRNRDTWTATVHQSIVQNNEFTGEFCATQQQRAFLSAWYGPGTFLRNYVHDMGGGIACYGVGTEVDILVEENIIGDPSRVAAGGFTRDMQGFGSWATTGNHSSCFTIRDFRLSTRPSRTLIVRRNRFFDVGPNTSGPFTIYGQEGPIDGNVYIEQNLITGNGWKVNISPNPNVVRNLTFDDNRMERGPGNHFGWFSTGVPGMVRTNNYELDRAQPLQRGALIS